MRSITPDFGKRYSEHPVVFEHKPNFAFEKSWSHPGSTNFDDGKLTKIMEASDCSSFSEGIKNTENKA